MWVLEANRQTLVDLLAGNAREIFYRAFHQDQVMVKPLSKDDVCLLWESDPREPPLLPAVIVLANGRTRDFLAWAITYLTSYRPFTAFFKVMEHNVLTGLQANSDLLSLNGEEAACVGTIIAEASLVSFMSGKKVYLTPNSCSGLLSFALTRAIAIGTSTQVLQGVTEKWFVARKLSDQSYSSELLREIDEICKVLLEFRLRSSGQDSLLFARSSSPIVDACLEIRREGRVSDNLWHQLTSGIEGLRDAHEHMQGTREERVIYFQHTLTNENLISSQNLKSANFLVGYLASLIAPGSLAHIDLVMKYISSFRTAALWYGMCGGLQRKNEVLLSFNVLGRRLLRELLRKERLLDPPTCDIALPDTPNPA